MNRVILLRQILQIFLFRRISDHVGAPADRINLENMGQTKLYVNHVHSREFIWSSTRLLNVHVREDRALQITERQLQDL